MARRQEYSLLQDQDYDDDGTRQIYPPLVISSHPVSSTSLSVAASQDASKIITDKGFVTLKKVLEDNEVTKGTIKILITGRTGMGKSTLVNSIIQQGKQVATEGDGEEAVTSEVKTHSFHITNDVTISLIDSPGLRHFEQQNQKFFSDLFEDMMIQGENTNIVLYCRKMTDQRLTADEITAIRQLYQEFGPHFWERVIIVFTFANKENCDYVEDGQSPPKNADEWDKLIEKRFLELVEKRSNKLKDIMREKIPLPAGVVDKIKFIPVGHYKASRACPEPLRLPGHKNWLYKLLKLCCTRTEFMSLSTLSLRENLHLAVIIDNEEAPQEEKSTTAEEGSKVKLNPQADALKKLLDKQGQLVLTFRNLSLQSIHGLVKAITLISSRELAVLTLIVLCKEKFCNEFEFRDIFAHIAQPFAKVPKIFFTHFTKPKKVIVPPERDIIPPKSIAFTVISENEDRVDFPVVNIFNEAVEASFIKSVTECFNESKGKIHQLDAKECYYKHTFDHSSSVLPSIYKPATTKAKVDFYKKKLDIERVMWRRVRSETVDALSENKDDIRKLLRNERIARIGTSITGMIVGGGLVIGGIAAAPFTFGASIGLAVAGGAVGAAAGMGGISALITRKVMANSRLKKAQEQVTFDQQLSKNVNETVSKYYDIVQTHLAEIAATSTGVAGGLAAGGRIGVAAAIGLEGVVETSALALRTGGRVAGMALAGVSLAVTVPIDLAFIAYHSYRIHQAKGDKSGAKESDPFVEWFLQQIEGLLLDTITLDKHDYVVEAELNLPQFGFHMQVEVPEYTITVRTLFSGPYTLPKGAILVSAVYDVSISKKLEKPVSIDIEHCVNVQADRSNTNKMSFAVGTLDFVTKAYTFTLLNEGKIDNEIGTIPVTESCLLCLVYTAAKGDIDSPLKYAAICGYERLYRNSWNMKVLFTKNLSAHLKFIEREFPVYRDTLEKHQFQLLPSHNSMILEPLNHASIKEKEWIIAPTIPDDYKVIKKIQLDTIELQSQLSDSPVLKVPFIDMSVQVNVEETAVDEFKYKLRIEGTDLNIPIERMKEQKRLSTSN